MTNLLARGWEAGRRSLRTFAGNVYYHWELVLEALWTREDSSCSYSALC